MFKGQNTLWNCKRNLGDVTGVYLQKCSMFCYRSIAANKAQDEVGFFTKKTVHCNDHDVIFRMLPSQSSGREVSWTAQIERVVEFRDGSQLQTQVTSLGVSRSLYNSWARSQDFVNFAETLILPIA